MPAGFSVHNSVNGNVQVDQDYRNLIFKTKAVATTTTLSGTGSFCKITIPNCTSPILAWSSTVHALIWSVEVTGSTWSWNIWLEGAVGTSFTYYVFDVAVASGLSFGIQVFDASGNLTFDSGQKYMRVRDFIRNISHPGGAGDRVYNAGRTYAVAQAKRGLWIRYSLGGPFGYTQFWNGTGARVSSNTVNVRTDLEYTFVSGLGQGAYTTPGDLLVLDVTNY